MRTIALHSTLPWPANARASAEAAASRWNCDIRVFDFPFSPHASWARLSLATRLSMYERVLTIDPDLIITQDCPNLFEHAPTSHVCMAPELQSRADTLAQYPWSGALARWRNQLGHRVAIEKHVQGGLCLYSPALHAPTFERMLGWWRGYGEFSYAPVYEQPLWTEVGERLFDLPIRRISPLLNCHTRDNVDPPRAFISHLTGGNKLARLERAIWQTCAQTPSRIVHEAMLMQAIWYGAPHDRRAIAEALRAVVRTSLFHEHVRVLGLALATSVYVCASVIAGVVTWVVAPSEVARARSLAQECGLGARVRVTTIADSHSTLEVNANAASLPICTLCDASPLPRPNAASRWWRRMRDPDAPAGSLSRLAFRTLRSSR
jgi:hypothetical protein